MATLFQRFHVIYHNSQAFQEEPAWWDPTLPWWRFDQKYGLFIYILVIAFCIHMVIFMLCLVAYIARFAYVFQREWKNIKISDISTLNVEQLRIVVAMHYPEYLRFQEPVYQMACDFSNAEELKAIIRGDHPILGSLPLEIPLL